MTKRGRKRSVKAWADVGSHGGIFVFEVGYVAALYPRLLHIYDFNVPGLRPPKGLTPVTITYDHPQSK